MAGLGLAVFLVTLSKLDLKDIAEKLEPFGWGLLAAIAMRSFRQTIFTYAWYWAFPERERKVPFRKLLQARLAGEAINYLIPSGTMGGEPVKAQMLQPYLSMANSLASVTVAKYSFILAQLFIMLLGGTVVLLTKELPQSLVWGLILSLAIITLGLAVIYYGQRLGMFERLSRILLLWRAGQRYLLPRLEKIKELDLAISSFHARQGKDFLISLGLNVIGWTEGIVEVYLILLFVGLPASLTLAFVIESMSLVISAAFFFVPWQAGTQEAGAVLIFQLAGLGPATGFALALVRRLTDLIWAGIGLVCLAISSYGRPLQARYRILGGDRLVQIAQEGCRNRGSSSALRQSGAPLRRAGCHCPRYGHDPHRRDAGDA